MMNIAWEIEGKENIIMAKCEMCGKGPQFGHKVSHSKQRSKRKFKPNIQRVRVMVDGKERRMQLCTRCLRTLTKKKK
jgi:large subunit ribosomal protein L28